MNQVKNFNKFQTVNYSYEKPIEGFNQSDQSSIKYGEDFLDMEIKSPELRQFKEDIDITKINNSSK